MEWDFNDFMESGRIIIMGDYNADPSPDLDKISMVAFGFGLFPLVKVKIDQFSTASDQKVYHFVQKIGSHRLQVLVNPADIPGI